MGFVEDISGAIKRQIVLLTLVFGGLTGFCGLAFFIIGYVLGSNAASFAIGALILILGIVFILASFGIWVIGGLYFIFSRFKSKPKPREEGLAKFAFPENRIAPAPIETKKVEGKKKSAIAAAGSNLLLLGAGYMYLGNWGKGIAVFFVGIIVAGLFGVLGGFVAYMYAILDSYREARKLNGESELPMPTNDKVGLLGMAFVVLIVLGMYYSTTYIMLDSSDDSSGKTSCPYECCISMGDYYEKNCISGMDCLGNVCLTATTAPKVVKAETSEENQELAQTEDATEDETELASNELDENIFISVKEILSFKGEEKFGGESVGIYELDELHAGPYYDYKTEWKLLIVDLELENKRKASYLPEGLFKIRDASGYTYDGEGSVGGAGSFKTKYFGSEVVQPREQLIVFVAFIVPNEFNPDTLAYESYLWSEKQRKMEFNLKSS